MAGLIPRSASDARNAATAAGASGQGRNVPRRGPGLELLEIALVGPAGRSRFLGPREAGGPVQVVTQEGRNGLLTPLDGHRQIGRWPCQNLPPPRNFREKVLSEVTWGVSSLLLGDLVGRLWRRRGAGSALHILGLSKSLGGKLF